MQLRFTIRLHILRSRRPHASLVFVLSDIEIKQCWRAVGGVASRTDQQAADTLTELRTRPSPYSRQYMTNTRQTLGIEAYGAAPTRRKLEQACAGLCSDYIHGRITLEELSRKIKSSVSSVRRVWPQLYGSSPSATRLAAARRRRL